MAGCEVPFEFVAASREYRVGVPRRRIQAVESVSLRGEPGEILGLLGPNGSGKTTLVKLLLGLCRPSAGEVYRLGRPASDRDTLGRVGYVHERPVFPPYLTLAEVLDFAGALGGLPRTARRRAGADWLDRLGLADRANMPVGRSSKGMVQRLALAQALLGDPDLLVLDEPFEGLDPDGRDYVEEVIRDHVGRDRAAILVTHDRAAAARLCGRIARLDAGRLVALGPPEGGRPHESTDRSRGRRESLVC